MSQLTICLLIFVLTIVGYCSGVRSLATVAITSLMALCFTGCLDAKTAIGFFANNNVIMVASMCVVAAGFNRTKACTTIAGKISGIAKGSPRKMMFGYVCIGVLLSQFIQSPVVVFGIVAPLCLASTEEMGLKASKTMFPLGISTVVTCCTLPFGAGATVPAELNGYLESYGYTDYLVGQLDPMKARLPMLIISILYFSFFAMKFAPDEPIVEPSFNVKKAAAKAPLSPFAEWVGIIIFFADAVALMFASQLNLQSWQITMVGALAMVWCGVLKPKEAAASVPLSMLFLIVGNLAISNALSNTGAGELVGGYIGQVVTRVNGNSYIIGLIFFVVPFILTQFMSNRGTMMIFFPIAIATCESIGGNPVGLMILIQAACLTAFMTPMATQAISPIMGYGGYDQVSMIKQSPIIAVISCIVSVGWTMTLFPIL